MISFFFIRDNNYYDILVCNNQLDVVFLDCSSGLSYNHISFNTSTRTVSVMIMTLVRKIRYE